MFLQSTCGFPYIAFYNTHSQFLLKQLKERNRKMELHFILGERRFHFDKQTAAASTNPLPLWKWRGNTHFSLSIINIIHYIIIITIIFSFYSVQVHLWLCSLSKWGIVMMAEILKNLRDRIYVRLSWMNVTTNCKKRGLFKRQPSHSSAHKRKPFTTLTSPQNSILN